MFSLGRPQEADGWGTMYSGRVRQVRQRATKQAKRARRQAVLLLPLIVAVILSYQYRRQLFGLDVEVRIGALGSCVLLALRLAGLHTHTLAVGGAITAVIFGLAAQQTLGNLIAGMVLLSARPFRIGDRVRLQGGGLAG